MQDASFFGRNGLVDSDGCPLSDGHIKHAHAEAGADQDVVRLAVYDAVDCACTHSIMGQLAGRETGEWGADMQDEIFCIADSILADWLALPKGDRKTLADTLEAHILEINAASSSAVSEAERERWRLLLASPLAHGERDIGGVSDGHLSDKYRLDKDGLAAPASGMHDHRSAKSPD